MYPKYIFRADNYKSTLWNWQGLPPTETYHLVDVEVEKSTTLQEIEEMATRIKLLVKISKNVSTEELARLAGIGEVE